MGAFVVNKCIFYSFQISVYLNHFANKSNNEEIVVRKYLLSRSECSELLGLVYTNDGSDGSEVVSGVGIGRRF